MDWLERERRLIGSEGVEKIAARLRDGGVRDLTVKLYPDMRHEILNEISKQTVWSDLLAWMQAFVR